MMLWLIDIRCNECTRLSHQFLFGFSENLDGSEQTTFLWMKPKNVGFGQQPQYSSSRFASLHHFFFLEIVYVDSRSIKFRRRLGEECLL